MTALRDRDRCILRSAQQKIQKSVQYVKTDENAEWVLRSFNKHIKHMNTVEGARELTRLYVGGFNNPYIAEGAQRAFEEAVPQPVQALWRAKFGEDFAIKPEDYAVGVDIPDCTGSFTDFLKKGRGQCP